MITKLIDKKNKFLATIDEYKAEIKKLEGKIELLDEIISEETIVEVKDIIENQTIEVAETCACEDTCTCEADCTCEETVAEVAVEAEQPVQSFYSTGI